RAPARQTAGPPGLHPARTETQAGLPARVPPPPPPAAFNHLLAAAADRRPARGAIDILFPEFPEQCVAVDVCPARRSPLLDDLEAKLGDVRAARRTVDVLLAATDRRRARRAAGLHDLLAAAVDRRAGRRAVDVLLA